MKQTIFKRFFPDDLHHGEGLDREIRERLPVRGRILDLGCGDNAILAPYRNPDREVWGADFAGHPCLQHAEWFRHLDPDGRIPFPDGFFDLVACISVMEHVTEPQTFLSEVSRVLRPGGYFVGHSISGSHYVTWIRRAFGLLPHSFNQSLVRRLYGRPEVDTFPAYYRLNRLEAILRAAQPNDLIEVRLRRYADPNYFSFWPPLISLAVVADWLLEKLASGWGRLYFTITLRNMHDP